MPLAGPLFIVGIGTVWGWRHAFWIAGIPGLIMAGLILWLVRNPPHERTDDAPKGSVIPLLKLRNIRFTMSLATLNMIIAAAIQGFVPLYLVSEIGLSNPMMGVVMTVQGVVMVGLSFIGPMWSDYIGRRAAIFGSYTLVLLGYLVLGFSNGVLPLVFIGAALAGGFGGAGMLVMVVVPGESAPVHLKATSMGFNAAVGEMIGAAGGSVLVGMAFDRVGLSVLPWLAIGAAALGMLVTLGLRETAPKVVARKAAAAPNQSPGAAI